MQYLPPCFAPFWRLLHGPGVVLGLLLCVLLSGCGAGRDFSLWGALGLGGENAAPSHSAAQSEQEAQERAQRQGEDRARKHSSATGAAAAVVPLRYTVHFALAEGDGEAAAGPDGVHDAARSSAPDSSTMPGAPGPQPGAGSTGAAAAVLQALREVSLLEKLRDSPPEDDLALQFRCDNDVSEARRILHSFGFYAGTVAVERSPGLAASSVPRDSSTHDSAVFAEDMLTSGSGRQGSSLALRVLLQPGPRYTVGQSVVYYQGEGAARADPALPRDLAPVALHPGDAADAGAIVDAVEALPGYMARVGYPLGKLAGTRYVLDHSQRALGVSVLVNTGPKARMGGVKVVGESAVQPEYVQRLRTWEEGRLWDQRFVERYLEVLTRQGLFRSLQADVQPAVTLPVTSIAAPLVAGTARATTAQRVSTADQSTPIATAASAVAPTAAHAAAVTATPTAGSLSPPPLSIPGVTARTAGRTVTEAVEELAVYDVVVTVADAPQRTVGGGLYYASDRGMGGEAFWEHRNFWGQGERLRAEAHVWQDSQDVKVTFRKPAFLHRTQELTGEAYLRNEDTLAYRQQAALLSAGIERRLARVITLSSAFSIEGGELQDPLHEKKAYSMGALPLALRYDATGSSLDRVRGLRFGLGLTPTLGWYGQDFSLLPLRADISYYVPLGEDKNGKEKAVLALRASGGSLWRDDAQTVPASTRYYGGGGGSVRGYAYQSLGPRDHNGDPLGGASFAEVSFEARLRVAKDISVAAFVDGGNVYPGSQPDVFNTGMQWGAGVGLRYHTPVGPVRLDVATPLNPRHDDGPIFLYISIGQSF